MKERDKIAQHIIRVHKNIIPMEEGWREQNDFRLQNFAYSIADWIIENSNCTCKDSTGWTDKPCCNICGKQVEGK